MKIQDAKNLFIYILGNIIFFGGCGGIFYFAVMSDGYSSIDNVDIISGNGTIVALDYGPDVYVENGKFSYFAGEYYSVTIRNEEGLLVFPIDKEKWKNLIVGQEYYMQYTKNYVDYYYDKWTKKPYKTEIERVNLVILPL